MPAAGREAGPARAGPTTYRRGRARDPFQSEGERDATAKVFMPVSKHTVNYSHIHVGLAPASPRFPVRNAERAALHFAYACRGAERRLATSPEDGHILLKSGLHDGQNAC